MGVYSPKVTSPEALAAGIPLPYSGLTGSVAQALRPDPQFLNVTVGGAQIGNSTYHALQINAQAQFGDLTFLGNYTISKQLGNLFFGGAGGFGLNYFQQSRSEEFGKIDLLRHPL